MAKIRRMRRVIGYGLFFTLMVIASLAWTMPLGMVNVFLPNVTLLNTVGNVVNGRWQDVEIGGKRYPLVCRYHREALGFSGLTYQVNCDAPLLLEATLSASFGGNITVTEALVSGDIVNVTPWFALLGVPVKASGAIALNLEKAKLENQRLTYLSLTGGAKSIDVFNTPLLNNVRIETLNPQLSDAKPIQLEIQTQAINKSGGEESENQWVKLYAVSTIDGKNYHTTGEISGKKLANYATVLRFFGQQTGNNRFAIQLQGALF